MKKFEEICGLKQDELKIYLRNFMLSKGYTVHNEDGFLFCEPKKNAKNVLLTAHMDTVHLQLPEEIHKVEYADDNLSVFTRVSSPQGIGGDDRCGIYMIMNIIGNVDKKPYVLFCEDEEVGCVGASKFCASRYVSSIDINYMIELDRRGKNDAVYYSCDNKEFETWITDNTHYKTAIGSCSDISKLMPAIGVAGVNFSCGYYNEHTANEYVVLEEMNATMTMVAELLEKEEPKKFEYVKKVYSYGNWDSFYNYDYDDDDYYYYKPNKKKDLKTQIRSYRMTLVATITDISGREKEVKSTGATREACWMNLFLDNEYLCFDDINDYYFI